MPEYKLIFILITVDLVQMSVNIIAIIIQAKRFISRAVEHAKTRLHMLPIKVHNDSHMLPIKVYND